MENLPRGLELRFHPSETNYPTWYEREDRRQQEIERPCFVNNGSHFFADGVEYPCQGYQFYFTQNRGIALQGALPFSRVAGYHAHDVEGVYILFDPATMEPRHVYYKAHGYGQGLWMLWDECEKTQDGALVVYMALYSHACYPESGDVVRIFGIANDQVADGGMTLRVTAENCVVVEEDVDFGDGIHLWSTIPDLSNTSVSDRERILLPFTEDDLRAR